MVLRARVVTRRFTQRLPSAHQRRLFCRLACYSFLVRMWEWLTAMPLLARVPVSWHTRDMTSSFCWRLSGPDQQIQTMILSKGVLHSPLHQGSHQLRTAGLESCQLIGFESANAEPSHVIEMSRKVLGQNLCGGCAAVSHQNAA